MPDKDSNEYKRIQSTGGSQFEGDRIKMEDVLGEDIIIHDFAIQPSQFTDEQGKPKDCVIIQATHNNVKGVIISGAGTIISILRTIDKAGLPMLTKIDRARSKKGRQIYVLS